MKPKAKSPIRKSRRSKRACALVVCVDPRTGMLKVVKAAEGCPKGFMRRAVDAARKGTLFPPDDGDE